MLQIHLVSQLWLRPAVQALAYHSCTVPGLNFSLLRDQLAHTQVSGGGMKKQPVDPRQLGLWLQEGFLQEVCIGSVGHWSSPSRLHSVPGAPGPLPDLSSQA